MKHRNINTSGIAAIGVLIAAAISGPAAFAQESDDADTIEEIIVTGSRLARTGFDTPSPVIVIGADEIRSSTAVTLGDMLNELPQLRSTFGLSNSSRFIGTAGIGSLDLRGLSTERSH